MNSSIAPFSASLLFALPFFPGAIFFLCLMLEGLSGNGSAVRSLFLFRVIVLCTLYIQVSVTQLSAEIHENKPNFRVSLPHRRSTTVSLETNPLYSLHCRDRFDQSLILAWLSAASIFFAIIVVTFIYQSFFSNSSKNRNSLLIYN